MASTFANKKSVPRGLRIKGYTPNLFVLLTIVGTQGQTIMRSITANSYRPNGYGGLVYLAQQTNGLLEIPNDPSAIQCSDFNRGWLVSHHRKNVLLRIVGKPYMHLSYQNPFRTTRNPFQPKSLIYLGFRLSDEMKVCQIFLF